MRTTTPVLIYDINGDGRGEVIVRLEEGEVVYLAVLDGMTGKVIRRTPWTRMLTYHSRTSTRYHLAIAYLDGKTPSIITQTGLYENEIDEAYDANLRRLWQYRSVAETSGGGSHHLDIADVDGDGKDEVFCGATLIGPDGKLRWSLYRQHPDVVAIKHILPGVQGPAGFLWFRTRPRRRRVRSGCEDGRDDLEGQPRRRPALGPRALRFGCRHLGRLPGHGNTCGPRWARQ